MRRTAPVLVGLLGVSLSVGPHAPAETRAGETRASTNKERRYFNARLGVGVEAPSGWSLSLHNGYANILCALLHPGGGRISLAVDRTTVKDAAGLFEQSRPGLLAQGLTVERVSPGPRDGLQIEARSARRQETIRQLYLVRDQEDGRGDRQAIVLTLTVPTDQLSAAGAPFDWVIAHLALEAPTHPEDKRDGGR